MTAASRGWSTARRGSPAVAAVGRRAGPGVTSGRGQLWTRTAGSVDAAGAGSWSRGRARPRIAPPAALRVAGHRRRGPARGRGASRRRCDVTEPRPRRGSRGWSPRRFAARTGRPPPADVVGPPARVATRSARALRAAGQVTVRASRASMIARSRGRGGEARGGRLLKRLLGRRGGVFVRLERGAARRLDVPRANRILLRRCFFGFGEKQSPVIFRLGEKLASGM